MREQLKEIFFHAEKSLKKQTWFSEADFEKKYGKFKLFENKVRTNDDFFQMLIMIIFIQASKPKLSKKKKKLF